MTKIYNIRPKDIALLFNKSYTQAYREFCNLRKFFKKEKHQVITIEETADYFGLEPEVIRARLLK